MILYRPTDGDVHSAPVAWRPRTAFLMAQLGGAIPQVVGEVREAVSKQLGKRSYSLVDADSLTTGKDFLLKIWQMVLSVPVGIAIVHEGIPQPTMANVFYELGWMQAYGKETLVTRVGDVRIPSDLVRTEYVPFDGSFERRFDSFVAGLEERATYYATLADLLERDPLLAIDYLRRAYLLTGNEALRARSQEIFSASGLEARAKNSVEVLLSDF